MDCNRCGAAAAAGATFCRECGAIIEVGDGSIRSGSSSLLQAAIWPGLRTAAIALALGAASATLLTALWRLAAGAPDEAAGSVLRLAANSWLVSHGAIEGVGLTLTGAAWLWLVIRLAITTERRRAGRPVEHATAAAATLAVVYGLVVLVLIEAVLPERAVDLEGIGVVPLAGTETTVVHAAVVIVVVFVSAFGAMLRDAGRRVGDLLPPGRVADGVVLAGAGALRAALIAVGSGAIVVTMHLLAQISDDAVGRAFADVGATVVWFGVDLAFGFVVAAMRFFTLELYPFQFGIESATPAWAWIGIPLVLAAYVAGGSKAARVGTRLGIRPFVAGLATGLGFTALAVGASGVAFPNLDGLSKTALLTSLGWVVVPAIAAVATSDPPSPMPQWPLPSNADV